MAYDHLWFFDSSVSKIDSFSEQIPNNKLFFHFGEKKENQGNGSILGKNYIVLYVVSFLSYNYHII